MRIEIVQTAFHGVAIRGLAVAVPTVCRTTADLARIYGEGDAERIARGTGVRTRRVVPPGMCLSDLCAAAAEAVLEKADVSREAIGTVIVVTQTPDYLLPATACLLHARLGLPPSVAAFDVGLGCSGYVYGLWLAYQLVAASGRLVLLCVGDTSSRLIWPEDRGTFPLFGDAGSATLIGPADDRSTGFFDLGTDGRGAPNLIIRNVGMRRWTDAGEHHEATLPRLEMNGAEVFSFTLREVPPLVSRALQWAGWALDDCDAVVFHQANAFILEHLRAKIGVPPEKFPSHIAEFGNTSSASIPLELVVGLAEQMRSRQCRLLLAGFGVGFSWGAAALMVGPTVVCPLVEING